MGLNRKLQKKSSEFMPMFFNSIPKCLPKYSSIPTFSATMLHAHAYLLSCLTPAYEMGSSSIFSLSLIFCQNNKKTRAHFIDHPARKHTAGKERGELGIGNEDWEWGLGMRPYTHARPYETTTATDLSNGSQSVGMGLGIWAIVSPLGVWLDTALLLQPQSNG